MALAPVTNLTVGGLTRSLQDNSSLLWYRATISWTNNEPGNHYIEISTTGTGAPTDVILAQRSQTSADITLNDWVATDANAMANRTVTIRLKVKSATDESPFTTVQRVLSLDEVGAISNDPLILMDEPGANAGSLRLPEHSGLRSAGSYGTLTYTSLGTTPVILYGFESFTPQTEGTAWPARTFSHAQRFVSRINAFSGFQVNATPRSTLGLLDGGFYKVVAQFRLAAKPTISGGVWTNVTTTVTREVVFEYWANGFPRPQITSPTSVSARTGAVFFYQVQATSPVGVASYAVNLGTATELSFDAQTRVITGTFAAVGTRTIELSATNSYGTTTRQLTISVTAIAPVITSALAATATAGVPFSYLFTATNATAYTVNFNGEPGLVFDANTRRITGAFTSGGTKEITLTAANSGSSVTATLRVTVSVVTPNFTSALTAQAVGGLPFSYTVAANNATDYEVAFGTVGGLTFDAQTRVISGVFSVAGTFNVQMTVSNPYASKTDTLVITSRAVAPRLGEYRAISGITRSGATATVTATNHGFKTGDVVNIVGATQSEYNGDVTVLATPTASTFTYAVSGTPVTPATAASAVDGMAAGLALKRATRAGEPFEYTLEATNATSYAVDFGNEGGLSFDPNTRRITGAFTSGGSKVLRVTAANLLAVTTRDLAVEVTISVPTLTSPAQVTAITGAPFSYTITATDAPQVQVTFGSALAGFNYDQIGRVITGVFSEQLSGVQNIDITLANDFATTNRQLAVNVVIPRLADPTNIRVGRLYRVWGANGKQATVYGDKVVPPAKFDVYGEITWQNTEARAHSVAVTVAGRRTFRPSGSTSALVLLASWTAPDVSAKTVTVTVQLIGSEYSSAVATLNQSVNGVMAASFNGDLQLSGAAIPSLTVPEWTGALDERIDALALRVAGIVGGGGFLGRLKYETGGAQVSGDYFLTSANMASLDLPPRLVKGEVYRGELTVVTGTVQARSTAYQTTWEGYNFATMRRIPPQYVTRQHYNAATQEEGVGSIIAKDLYFEAPEPVGAFTVSNATALVVRNREVRIELKSSYRATWTINSGAPAGFGIEYVPAVFGASGPEQAFLVGSPTAGGSFTVSLTARRSMDNASAVATVGLTVLDSLPRTTIAANSTIARDGLALKVGDEVNIAFLSTPSNAVWTASGLPPGVVMNQDGKLVGRVTVPGVYIASIAAQAAEYEVSLPTTIKFNISVGDVVLEDYTASGRSPWLLVQWQLIDLHVLARSRDVQSTMFESGALRVKLGDALNFAIFFVDAADVVFALGPERLRLTIRREDNLDDLIIFKSATPPVEVLAENSAGQVYYELNVTTGNRERDVALEWAERDKKNEPLKCVADIDWVKDGKTYSSRTFPVLLELDVTRP
jgi:hypothetical protein